MRHLSLYLILVVGCAGSPSTPKTIRDPKSLTRDQIRAEILGRTEKEVRDLLGPPDRIDTQFVGNRVPFTYWVYKPLAVSLKFHNGVCADVAWSAP